MSSIFFNISSQMESEIKHFMQQEGFTSKAEFFRFLVKFFKYNRRQDEVDFQNAVEHLEETIKTLDKRGLLKKLPSLEEQLTDV